MYFSRSPRTINYNGHYCLMFLFTRQPKQQFVCVLKPQDRLRLSRSVCWLQAIHGDAATWQAGRQCRLIQLPGRRYGGKERKGKARKKYFVGRP